MKIWQILGVLSLSFVLVGAAACNSLGNGGQAGSQRLEEVQRGDLTVSVSGSGNIEVSNEAKLVFGGSGRVNKIYVEEGDKVSEGEVLAELELGPINLAVAQAQLTLAQAQVALETAQHNLETTDKTYSLVDIKVAEAEVDQARRNLDDALWIWSKYEVGTPGWEDYQKVVLYFQASLDTAKNKLDAMLSGFDKAEVVIKKLQVEAAESQVQVAEQAVAEAQRQLDEAIITAPYSGVIASVNVDEADVVSAGMEIIHLIDDTSMELTAEVDEIDIAEVKPGQRVTIDVDALPDVVFDGTVKSISPLPEVQSGVVVYDVKISLDVPPGSELKAGMSATADIIIDERSNVLLVPNRAITQDSEGNMLVNIMVDNKIEERIVVTGISDDFDTEIVEGVKEGDVVVVGS